MIDKSSRSAGFTLMEILVAISLLAILGILLSSLFSQSLTVWLQGLNENSYRNRARATLDYIKRDLELADLARNQPALVASSIPTLEFLTDPAGIPGYADSFFWQAPISTDDRSMGNMAEVGYFVQWINGHGTLCRFFVNPSDTAFYNIYKANPSQWISQTLLAQIAPATGASHYRGLFLTDIVGLWIQVYPDPALSTVGYANPYDSSTPPDSAHPLPSYAVIQVTTLDAPTAIRVANVYSSGSSPPAIFGSAYAAAAAATNSMNAEVFAANLNQIPLVKGGARAFSLRVHFNNYRTYVSP